MPLKPDNDGRRGAGILMPIHSLPSPYGIGNIGPAAFAFIDFLARSGQKYWQILPLGPTDPAFGNSPYMSCSSLAGNPLFISPEPLLEKSLLKKTEIAIDGFSEYLVDYPRVTDFTTKLLRLAYQRCTNRHTDSELEKFKEKNPWALDYALFLSLKKRYRQAPWYTWPKEIRLRKSRAVAQATTELGDEIDYHIFVQYLFCTQWGALRQYAREKDIRIIGDLPIYVALDSVDVWVHQEIFELEATSGRPKSVAGVPPDYFSPTGQLWGNPLYRWHARSPLIKKHLYDWWQHRLKTALTMMDVIRIDHFRGFSSYWSIPAREKTAINGSWKKGPGISFFREMEDRLGRMSIIAEDLGIITPEVEHLRDELGYPGMKILLFAFDGDANNSYLPHNYTHNCVVYTGTHDNDTAVGWYLSPTTKPQTRRRAKRQANQLNDDAASFHRDMIYLAHSSVADIAVIPMQDILGFGNDCRMNTPGTSKGNWRWRCADRFITDELAVWLYDVTAFFNRLNKNKKTAGGSRTDATAGAGI
ncbi:MAG TPA: 4-alpha-glucanotransferase [Desulfobulbus sp.]|nr:4-alpha-glucanotransferase [Desulfobulbus sp.]